MVFADAFEAPAQQSGACESQGLTAGPGVSEPRGRGPHPLDFLVRDRFDEFREMADKANGFSGRPSRRFGRSETRELAARVIGRSATSLSLHAPASGSSAPAEQPGSFMRQFFESVGEVQGHISAGRCNVKQMCEAVQSALGATSQAQEKEASQRVQALTQEVNKSIGAAKEGLEILKARTDLEAKQRPHAQEVKIRNSMQQGMGRKHQQLLLEFQRVQADYKDGLKARQERELAILMPEISAEEREEMIQNGETSAVVLVQKMAGAHASVSDEVNRIREKHQDVIRLEQNIADLAQTFQEMAVLVNAQGEMLDSIEVHTRQVKTATAQAEKNLVQTRKAQHKHRRHMCCLMIIMIILAIIILTPVLVKAGQ